MIRSQPNIRELSANDIGTIVRVAQSASPYPWSEQVFHDCFKASYHGWVLSKEGLLAPDSILGFVISLVQAPECQLVNICVRPEEQGQGYGRLLLQHAIDDAWSLGCHTIYLEVRAGNLAAIQLYENAGFLQVGIRKYYYPAGNGREDAVVMALGV